MRTGSFLLALVLVFTLCVPVSAEESVPSIANAVLDKAIQLMMNTGNVTLNATAEFAFEGERFKSFTGEYRQSGTDSYMYVSLSTPKTDGSEYVGGYTVYGLNDKAYSIDTYNGGYYVEHPLVPCATVLKNDTLTQAGVTALKGLTLLLAGGLDPLITETKIEGDCVKYDIAFSEGEIPELINSGLSLLALSYIKDHYYFAASSSACAVEYENWDASVALNYEKLFGTPIPENFMHDLQYGSDEAIWNTYMEVYDLMSATSEEEAAGYDGGVLYVKADGSTQWLEKYEDYMRLAKIDNVYYDDYQAVYRNYYQMVYGEEMTETAYNVIMQSANEELWNAYSKLGEEMDAYYQDIAARDERAVGLRAYGDGSYKYLYEAAIAENSTVKLDILRMTRAIELSDASVTLTTDTEGRIAACAGNVSVNVIDAAGEKHLMTIRFDTSATAYGDTAVEDFDAEKLGVKTYEQYYSDLYAPIDAASRAEYPETLEFAGASYASMIRTD